MNNQNDDQSGRFNIYDDTDDNNNQRDSELIYKLFHHENLLEIFIKHNKNIKILEYYHFDTVSSSIITGSNDNNIKITNENNSTDSKSASTYNIIKITKDNLIGNKDNIPFDELSLESHSQFQIYPIDNQSNKIEVIDYIADNQDREDNEFTQNLLGNNNNIKLNEEDREFNNSGASINSDFIPINELNITNQTIDREIFADTIDLVLLCVYTYYLFIVKPNHMIYNFKTGLFYRYEVVHYQLKNIISISNRLKLDIDWLPRNVKLDDWINDVHTFGNQFFEEIYSHLLYSLYRLATDGSISEEINSIVVVILSIFDFPIIQIQNIRKYKYEKSYIENVLVDQFDFIDITAKVFILLWWFGKPYNASRCLPALEVYSRSSHITRADIAAMGIFGEEYLQRLEIVSFKYYYDKARGSINTDGGNNNNKLTNEDTNFGKSSDSINNHGITADELLDNIKRIATEIFANTIDLVFICFYTIFLFTIKPNHDKYNFQTGLFYRYEVVHYQLKNIIIVSNKLNINYEWLPHNVKLDDWFNNVHTYGNQFFEEIYPHLQYSLDYLATNESISEEIRSIVNVILTVFEFPIQNDTKFKYEKSYIMNALVKEFGFPGSSVGVFVVLLRWFGIPSNASRCLPLLEAHSRSSHITHADIAAMGIFDEAKLEVVENENLDNERASINTDGNDDNNKLTKDDYDFENTNVSINNENLPVNESLAKNENIVTDIFYNTVDLALLCIYTYMLFINKPNHMIYNFKTGLFYRYEVVHHQLKNIIIISNRLKLDYNWLPYNTQLNDWYNNVHAYANLFFREICSHLKYSLNYLATNESIYEEIRSIVNVILTVFEFPIQNDTKFTYEKSYIVNVLINEFGFDIDKDFNHQYNMLLSWSKNLSKLSLCLPVFEMANRSSKMSGADIAAMSLFKNFKSRNDNSLLEDAMLSDS